MELSLPCQAPDLKLKFEAAALTNTGHCLNLANWELWCRRLPDLGIPMFLNVFGFLFV